MLTCSNSTDKDKLQPGNICMEKKKCLSKSTVRDLE